ncbi:hypothetical protein [Acinetobacter venetianus]|jgi:hypothetical protein|uniref:hypothetical protein n=1 Tax=Acinetobacter venetianus TaxID=52133 RepID=UPI000775BF64|nr:hypothetical protein [Acinetobacter venetianus]KXO78260.1 hypothetical protein AYL20_07745 [Acinetobacter venetianus]
MKKTTSNVFVKGVCSGVIGTLSVFSLGYGGIYLYQQQQIKSYLNAVEQYQSNFVQQLEQQYFQGENTAAQQVLILNRNSSQIQKEIVENLQPKDGITLKFDRLQLMASFDRAHVPPALAHYQLFFQPQSQINEKQPVWQCFSDLPDDLRPQSCLYRQEAPSNYELLRQALTTSLEERRSSRDYTILQRPQAKIPVETECTKFKAKLPQDFDIYATGAYSGRKSNYQIDDSGHQATEMDIHVQHDRPVVLLLGAYEPSIWKIKWDAQTKIVGVIATGYHKQQVLGLPKSVPILETAYKNSQCGYAYISEDKATEVNQLAQKILQKDIKAIVLAKNGQANIGNISSINALQSSNDRTINDVIDKNAPLAGEAGIRDAVAKGLLRPATRTDIDAWKAAHNKANNIHTPPVIGSTESSSGTGMEYVHFHNAYVVLKEMTIPAGLYGAHSVTFFVPKGVPVPKGNRGHSTIYDMNIGNCIGSSPDCLHR